VRAVLAEQPTSEAFVANPKRGEGHASAPASAPTSSSSKAEGDKLHRQVSQTIQLISSPLGSPVKGRAVTGLGRQHIRVQTARSNSNSNRLDRRDRFADSAASQDLADHQQARRRGKGLKQTGGRSGGIAEADGMSGPKRKSNSKRLYREPAQRSTGLSGTGRPPACIPPPNALFSDINSWHAVRAWVQHHARSQPTTLHKPLQEGKARLFDSTIDSSQMSQGSLGEYWDLHDMGMSSAFGEDTARMHASDASATEGEGSSSRSSSRSSGHGNVHASGGETMLCANDADDEFEANDVSTSCMHSLNSPPKHTHVAHNHTASIETSGPNNVRPHTMPMACNSVDSAVPKDRRGPSSMHASDEQSNENPRQQARSRREGSDVKRFANSNACSEDSRRLEPSGGCPERTASFQATSSRHEPSKELRRKSCDKMIVRKDRRDSSDVEIRSRGMVLHSLHPVIFIIT
jgi:hypothetical protein